MNTLSPGFFGKLPSTGDFVSRRLPRAFVQRWDAWLSRVLATRIERCGPGWLDAYLVSPFWRFALPPGLCGETAWAGVMMASVDRVGRAFPMTVAAPVGGGVFVTVLQSDAWFSALEDRLLAALHDGAELEDFDLSLTELTAPRPQWPAPDSAAWRIGLADSDGIRDGGAMPPSPWLLDRFARHDPAPCSCWATTGSPSVPPSLLVCTGLPDERQFGALIDGRWRDAGWAEPHPTTSSDPLLQRTLP